MLKIVIESKITFYDPLGSENTGDKFVSSKFSIKITDINFEQHFWLRIRKI